VSVDDGTGSATAPGTTMILTHDAVRAGRIAKAVGRAGLLPTVAFDHAALLEVLREHEVALLIVDAAALDDRPEVWLTALRRRCDTPVLLLVDGQQPSSAALLRAGATSAAPLWIDDAELGAQARALLRLAGADSVVGGHARWGPLELDLGRRSVRFHGRSVALTPLQLRILNVLVTARGDVVSPAAFYRLIWRTPVDDDGQRLGAHVHRIRERLGDDPPRFLLTVRGEGYRLADVEVDPAPRRVESQVLDVAAAEPAAAGPAVKER
jgi:two-component system, OmpR family, KDP operon response regulator KdpE